MEENGDLTVGQIVGAHGIAGAVKAHLFSGPDCVFAPDDRVRLKTAKGDVLTFALDWARPHKQNMLMGLAGVTTRSQAEALVGAQVVVARCELPPLEPGTHYWTDLIGLTVHAADRGCIGRISAIIPTAGNDVYVVRDGQRETLIPAVASVVLEIDLKAKTMRVDLPEGL